MTNYYIKGASDKWVRPAGWLAMPNITSADNKLAFLYAVYPNRANNITIVYAIGSINADVDWGDGTSEVINNAALRSKTYNYNTITSPVLQDKNGNNYKQVVIELTYNSGTISGWTIGFSNAGVVQILEAIISWPNNVNLSASRLGLPLMENLIIRKLNYTSNISAHFRTLTGLRNIEGFENITTTTVGNSNGLFSEMGEISQVLNVNWTCSSAQNYLQNSNIKRLGNITFNQLDVTSAILTNAFAGSNRLEEVGNFTAIGFTTLTGLFNLNYMLRKIGNINTPNLTLASSMFGSCFSLEEIVFVSTCANITTTATMFNNCRSLRKLRLPNIAISFSIANCNMMRPELVDLFNDLATVVTPQTITITGNPGVPDLTLADENIAVNKGWSVTKV
jgi:hypothetical protein